MSSQVDLKIDWCSYEAAKYAVENWHYSKTMPVSKSSKIGIWEDGVFVGVVIFALGANPNLSKPYNLEMFEVAELVRVALRKHSSPVSKILSRCIKMVRKQSPGIRLLVSFADTDQGHHGGIYQAGNWIYSGQTPKKFDYFMDGIKLQRRSYTGKNFGKPKMRIPARAKMAVSPPKHRYLYPLDAEMKKQIEPLRKPYPKRAVSIASDAPADHAGEGGANPTTALHNETTGA